MSYIYNLADTWDNAGTVFTAIKMNVTDVASNASSALLDLQVGGVSQFKVSKAGAVTAVGVAIPTISSSDTLTNKTLSSPVLSGTVSGTPTYSGSPTYNARLLVNARNSDFKDENFGGTSTGVWGAARFYADAAYSGIVIQADTSQSASLIRVINSTDTADLAAMSATGSWSVGGVAVPTISSSDTLTNKTLSSPTLSGTVAGTPTFSGTVAFAAISATNVNAAGTSLPLTVNSTNSNQLKVTLSDNGTARGYLGADGTFAFVVANNAVSNILTLTQAGAAAFASTVTVPNNVSFRVTGTGADVRNAVKMTAADVIEFGTVNNTTTWNGFTHAFVTPAGTGLYIDNANVVTIGGAVVPTVSSTSTLTNKTLSSPTLSGTVAGSPALTGQWQWSGGNDAAYWHAIVLAPTDAGNNKPSLYITHTSPSAYAIGLFDGTDTDGTIAFNCGVLNHNGVAIPTISSSDTLSNKTLSGVTIADNTNIVLNTTNGTKIGTSTSQKLGFFNKTPVVQPTAVADATGAGDVVAQLNALLSRMRDLGLIAT